MEEGQRNKEVTHFHSRSQTTTPYRERAHANLIDTQYNAHLTFPTKDHTQPSNAATIQAIQPQIEKYRYMFEKIRNKAEGKMNSITHGALN